MRFRNRFQEFFSKRYRTNPQVGEIWTSKARLIEIGSGKLFDPKFKERPVVIVSSPPGELVQVIPGSGSTRGSPFTKFLHPKDYPLLKKTTGFICNERQDQSKEDLCLLIGHVLAEDFKEILAMADLAFRAQK